MEQNALPYRKIIFVCTHQRAEGERVCCANRGGAELRDALKAMVKARRLKGKIRVSQSGCMDQCEKGANIMVFPDNTWWSAVNPEDLEPLLDELEASLRDPNPAQ